MRITLKSLRGRGACKGMVDINFGVEKHELLKQVYAAKVHKILQTQIGRDGFKCSTEGIQSCIQSGV